MRSKIEFMHHYSELKLLIHPRKSKNKILNSSISNNLLIEGEKINKLRVQFLKIKYIPAGLLPIILF